VTRPTALVYGCAVAESPPTPQFSEAYVWSDRDVVDRDGESIGRLEDVYLDDATREPEWLLVHTGLFGRHLTFVPVADARPDGEDVRVAFSKLLVKDAPRIEPGGSLTQEEEARLYRHYGLAFSAERSATLLPQRPPAADPPAEDGAGA